MPAALSYQLQQSALRVVVVLMHAHVRRKLVDTFGKKGDLHLRGTGVSLMSSVVLDDGCRQFLRQHLALPPRAPVVSSFGLVAV